MGVTSKTELKILSPAIAPQAAPPIPNAELMNAVATGDAARVEALLARGHVEVEAGQPLARAVISQHARICTALLKAGADPRARGASGLNCVHLAVATGNATILLSLLEAAADAVDSVDDLRMTPLMHALLNGHEQIARLLLDKGASPLAADAADRSAYDHSKRADDIRERRACDNANWRDQLGARFEQLTGTIGSAPVAPRAAPDRARSAVSSARQGAVAWSDPAAASGLDRGLYISPLVDPLTPRGVPCVSAYARFATSYITTGAHTDAGALKAASAISSVVAQRAYVGTAWLPSSPRFGDTSAERRLPPRPPRSARSVATASTRHASAKGAETARQHSRPSPSRQSSTSRARAGASTARLASAPAAPRRPPSPAPSDEATLQFRVAQLVNSGRAGDAVVLVDQTHRRDRTLLAPAPVGWRSLGERRAQPDPLMRQSTALAGETYVGQPRPARGSTATDHAGAGWAAAQPSRARGAGEWASHFCGARASARAGEHAPGQPPPTRAASNPLQERDVVQLMRVLQRVELASAQSPRPAAAPPISHTLREAEQRAAAALAEAGAVQQAETAPRTSAATLKTGGATRASPPSRKVVQTQFMDTV